MVMKLYCCFMLLCLFLKPVICCVSTFVSKIYYNAEKRLSAVPDRRFSEDI